jgi:membrane-associated phospholipid phosphatase
VRAAISEHATLLAISLSYVAVGGVVLRLLGRPWPVDSTARWFVVGWLWGSTIWLAVHVAGRRFGGRSRLSAAQVWGAALVAMLAVPVHITFQSLKQSIAPVRGFPWDDRLAALDRTLHGGAAWRWVEWVLRSPTLLKVIDLLYVVWFVALFIVVVWLCWTHQRSLRKQALLAFVLLWIGGGTVGAWALASSGPCYRTRVDADAAELIARLDASGSAQIARRNQRNIWAAERADIWAPFGGVAAMPSLHVGLSVLVAIIVSRRSRRLGVALWGYAALIQVGSVVLGWHYAIDGYAGALCAWGAWSGAGLLTGIDAVRVRRAVVRCARTLGEHLGVDVPESARVDVRTRT